MPASAHDQTLSFRFVDGGAGAMTRGYVAHMLYDMGSRPPVMDLPVFLRDKPPAN